MHWNSLFRYCDGKLYWKHPGAGRQLDKTAGSPRQDGYHAINIGTKKHRAHRIIWEMFHGPIPEGLVIDHIDSDRSNNKIENLRLATRTQNGTRSFSNARAGWKGVQWTANGTYQSILPLNSVNLVLGTFGGAADAALMYNFVAAEWYGQFARYNEAEQTWFDNGSEVAVDIVKPR